MSYRLFIACYLLLTPFLQAEEWQFHSQCGQDSYLYNNFFKDKIGGVFLDIGAHDGMRLSNTYFFEKNLGWTGICIEPIPAVFEVLKNCRSCLCVHGAICDKYETANFLVVHGPHAMLSGILEFYDPRHLNRVYRSIEADGGSLEICPVKCYNVNKLLADNNITHVDYLSIDTEGGELEILKSIDFDKVRIDIIDVENNFFIPNYFSTFLESKGYKYVTHLQQDEIYIKMD